MTGRLREPVPQNVLPRVTCELVTNAVRSTCVTEWSPDPEGVGAIGAHHLIGVQLRLVDAGLYVEVWDGGTGSPAVAAQAEDAEGGRGLLLVESLSRRWGTAHPAAGGKVVWSELALTGSAEPPPPGTGLPLRCPGGHDPSACEELRVVDFALMQRVVDGLCLVPRYGTGTVAV